VISPSAVALAAVVLALPAPVLAQEQTIGPLANLPLTAVAPALPPAPEVSLGAWRFRPDVMLKGESPRPPLDGIPRWNLGVRTERQLFSHLNVGGMATLSRGGDGPFVSSAELGTLRNLWQTGSLTGPGTYRTVFNSALTFSVPVKQTGHVKMKLIGEFWNPFGDKLSGDPGNDVALAGRAFKIGLRMTF
jgi:hypothetical protein